MSKKIKFAFIGLLSTLLVFVAYRIYADNFSITVTVGQVAPSFTVTPAENPASHAGAPTYEGQNVNFQATATDANGENYYMAVCQVNSVTAVDGDAPLCDTPSGSAVARGVAVDDSGNVYLVGYFSGSVDFGFGIVTSGGDDYFVAKYNSSGVIQWVTREVSSANPSQANSVATDPSGNVYVTGNFAGIVDFGNGNIDGGGSDYFVLKLNSAGVVQWVDHKDSGAGTIESIDIAVDSNGNVYAVGYFWLGSVDFGAGSWAPAFSLYDYFIVKYDTNGNFQWADREDAGTGAARAWGVATDDAGNVYVAGNFQTAAVNFGAGSWTPTGYDYFVIKYDTNGNFQWADRENGGTGSAFANGVGVDSSGDVYVVGAFDTAAVNFGGGNLTPAGRDYFIVKYDTNGVYQWVDREDGGTGDVDAVDVAADNKGGVYVVGRFDAAAVDFGAGSWTPTGYDYFVIKYDTNGVYQWADRENGGAGSAFAGEIAADLSGNVYVSGYFETAAVDFGGGSWVPTGIDYVLLKYDSTGGLQWADRENGGSWCISSSTASGAQASCSYTTNALEIQENSWYAFVCDGNASGAECSASSQGSGNSGSTFYVTDNPAPSITAGPAENPASHAGTPTYRGNDVTFQTTATDPTSEGYYMTICKLPGINANQGAAPDCNSNTASVTVYSTTVDSAGNMMIAGFFNGIMDFGGGQWHSTAHDFFVAKYSADGAFLWARREVSGTGSSRALGVTTDSSNNVYVAGIFLDNVVDFGAGSWTPTNNDYFVVKYDSNGNFQWADREDAGTGSVFANGIAADSSGNVYVTGYFETAAVDFGAGSWAPANDDYFVIKYDTNGVYQWADREDAGTGNAVATSIAVDASGNVYATGYFLTAAVNFGAGSWTPTGTDYFVIKYDTNGVYQWVDRENAGTGSVVINSIATDAGGNVYVGGRFSAAAVNFGSGALTPTGFDYAVVKYDTNGNFLWVDREDGGTGTAEVNAIDVDSNGNVYASGYFSSAAVNFGTGNLTPAGQDYFVVKYDTNGAFQWVDREDGGAGSANSRALAVGPNDEIYASGYFHIDVVDFGAGSWTPFANTDYFIVKYDPSGELEWVDHETGGAWCASSLTASGAQASCSYTTTDKQVEINEWYAYVCDANVTNASCSAVSSGAGNSGSPYVVVENAAPAITATPAENPISSVVSPTYEGQDVTFQGTGTDPNNANYYMAVCKSELITPQAGGAPFCVSPGGSSYIRDLVVDGSGNFYATGYFTGSVEFGNGLITANSQDYFVAKYDSEGSLLWIDTEDSGAGNAAATGVAVDNSGNVYVTGSFNTADVDFGAGLWTPNDTDYFVVKYNSAGVFQWADREDGGTGSANASGIAVDGSGNAYVTGSFSNSAVDFGAGSWAPSNSDYFVIKYDTSGVYQWADRENSGTGSAFGIDIAADAAGNIYVAGQFSTAAIDFGAGSWSPTGMDYFVIKYDTSGVYQWVDRENAGTGSVSPQGIAVDSSSNVYVAGFFSAAAVNFGSGSLTPSSTDYFVIKYDTAGNFQWVDREDAGTGGATAIDIGVDDAGNIAVAGYFTSAAVNFGAGLWTPTANDYFVVKYDTNGAYQWADREDAGAGGASGWAVALGSGGEVIVGGDFTAGSVDFGGGAMTPPASNHFFVKYNTTGAIQFIYTGVVVNANSWCVSTATASGAQASCSYTTSVYEIKSNAWYAYLCDADAFKPKCSAVSQGTGDSGSPFVVEDNQAPSFAAGPNENPASSLATPTYEGDNVTFQATATDLNNAQYYLAICKTNGITAQNGGAPICASSTGSASISSSTVDSSGNYYVVGQFTGQADLGAGLWTAGGGRDYFVAKYNSEGTLLWIDRENGGTGDAYANSVAVDPSGNVYVVGYFELGDVDFGAGLWTPTDDDYYVIKYDTNGVYQWADRENAGAGRASANAVVADSSGNVYVAGVFNVASVDFGAGLWVPTALDYFVIKYDTNGNYQWVDREDAGTGAASANSVAVDSSGNVYVAGHFQTAAVNFGAGNWTPSNLDYFVIKYDSAGVYQWADREDAGTGLALAASIAVDASANVYVGGYFSAAAVNFGAGNWTPSGQDYFIVKYDTNGAYQWVDREDAGTGSAIIGQANSVATDSQGNVYIVGYFSGAAVDFGAGSWTPSGTDYFLVKYNTSGAFQWADRENGGTGDAYGYGVSADANSNVYVSGLFATSGVDFGAGSTTPSSNDFFLLKYDQNANIKWISAEISSSDPDWCVSAATNSGVQASCNYNTTQYEVESNRWYAYVCDADNLEAKCSSVAQGSGDGGSPFIVSENQAPTISAGPVENPASTLANPTYEGNSVTFQATATDMNSANYYMAVCRSASVTANASAAPTCNFPSGTAVIGDIDIDSSGNVLVTGTYSGQVDIGAGIWESSTNAYFVAKYTTDGDFVWADRQNSGTGVSSGSGIAVDTSGNVYVSGEFSNSAVDFGAGSWTPASGDYFIIKYNSAGVFQWADRENAGTGDVKTTRGVAADASGNVYLAGYFSGGDVDFGAGLWTPTSNDYFVIKYDSAGNFQWADRENAGTGSVAPNALNVDAAGNVYVVGGISLASVDLGAGLWAPGGTEDYFVIKYDTNGNYLWADRENSGTGNVLAQGVAIDGSGNVYVNGYFYNAAVDFGAGSWTPGGVDYFVIKYDSTGAYQWVDRENAGTGSVYSYGIDVDASGNVFVSGHFLTADVNFGAGLWTPTSNDYFIIKYDTNGVYQWADRENGGAGAAYSYSLAVDQATGAAYVTGSFTGGDVDFGAGNWTPQGSDYLLAKYEAGGRMLWVDRENGGSWCVSSSAASGAQASCNYTTHAYEVQSNVWYAYACDGGPLEAKCSSVAQGSGDSGSPFVVVENVAPTLAAGPAENPESSFANPTYGGESVTFQATATDPNDADYYLAVCRSGAVTANASLPPTCASGTSSRIWATDVAVDSGNNMFIAGYLWSGTVDFGGGMVTFPNNTAFVVKYDAYGSYQWAAFPTMADGSSAVADSLAIDSSNNVYVAGYFDGTGDFGAGDWTASSRDYFVVSYTNGGAYRWADREDGGTGWAEATGVVADAVGGVYVSGLFRNASVDFGAGSWSPSSADLFLVKYNSTGTYQWALREANTGSVEAKDIAADSANNVYVVGVFNGTVDFGGGNINSFSDDYFVVKYDAAGAFQWADQENSGSGDAYAIGVAVDVSDNVYVTGRFGNASVDFGAGSWTPTQLDYFVIKYDANGVYQWADREDAGTGTVVAQAVDTDSAGNVYVSGYFQTAAVNFGAGSWTPTASDYFVVKYDTNGVYQWADREDGGTGVAEALGIAVDSLGNTYVSGFYGPNLDFGAGAVSPAGDNDFFVLKYSESGTLQRIDHTRNGAWCVSTATASGAQASCNFAVNIFQEAGDWKAFLCDGNSINPKCSVAYVGGGATGSPFFVEDNIAPSLSTGPAENPASTALSPTYKGGSVTFEATATDPNDANYYLAICKLNGITAVSGNAPACSTSTGNTFLSDVATDSSGNFYAAGRFNGTVNFGLGNWTATGLDYFIIKYDTNGKILWADREDGGTGNAYATGVATDSTGNVYVSGYFYSGTSNFGAGEWTPTSYDYFVIKYDSAGNYQWVDRENSGSANVQANDIAVDASGDVYVVGFFASASADFGTGSLTPTGEDYFVVKYNSAGTVQWVDRENSGAGYVIAEGVATDASGNIYVAGRFSSGDVDFGAGLWTPSSHDYFVIKYDSAGNYQWVDREDAGTGNTIAWDVATDASGNVYVAGQFGTASVDFGAGSWTPTSLDYFVVKYDSAGAFQWADRENSGSASVIAKAVTTDGDGNVYVTGSFSANTVDLGAGNWSPSSNDYFIIKYNSSGAYQWADRERGGSGTSYSEAIASDSDGNVYIGGFIMGQVDFGDGVVTPAGDDMYVLRFNANTVADLLLTDVSDGDWCTSTATSSGAMSSCAYTISSLTPGENPWYAFVCDGNSITPKCSTVSQGTGDSGSSFFVADNVAPEITAGPAESPASDAVTPTNQGNNVVFTATGTDPYGEDYYLAICQGNAVSGNAGTAPTCGTSTGGATAYATAVDSSGNVIIAGVFDGTVNFGAGNWTAVNSDYFVAKYDSNGDLLWADREDSGTGNATATAVTVDSSGNVYVAGYFDAEMNIGAGSWTAISTDYFVIKYNSSGVYQWADREDSGTGNTFARGIAVDASANVYVAGSFNGTVNFGAGSWAATASDYFVIKYNSSGVYQWADREDSGTSNATANAVATDNSGNVYVVGFFQGTVDVGAGSWADTNTDYFVIKYDSSGVYQWADRENSGTGGAYASDVSTDSSGNVYIAGYFSGGSIDLGAGSWAASGADYFVIKYDSAGVFQWADREDSGAGTVVSRGITIDSSDNVYVVGYFQGTVDFGAGSWAATASDYFVVKYNSAGTYQWADREDSGSGTAEATAVSVDINGNTYVAGYFSTAAVSFGAGSWTPTGNDYFLVKYNTNGGFIWADREQGGTWCVSGATASGAQASCNYATTASDVESNRWYAFVCDGNSVTGPLCSLASQGTGSSGSPFKVNHRPAFTAASTDQPNYNPGATVTFQSTASDSDIDTSADTVTLLVCRTVGVTGTACDGGAPDTWCTSSASASNPTCNVNLPAVQAAGVQDAYVYIFDNHGLAANSGTQGSNVQFTINNTAPVISAITLNGGADIALTEGTTTTVPVTATVTDTNSCQGITSVTTTVYRSGVTYAGCDTGGEANANSCYAVITCTVVGGSCTGASDASADYTCTASIQYHADPTDASTQFTAENWRNTVIASDGTNTTSTQISAGVEMLSLVGYDTSGSIAYGNLNVGQSNDPLDRILSITATGNVGLDVEFSGTDMTGAGTIAVGNQRHSLSAATPYASGTALTGSPVEYEINVPKTTVSGTPQSRNSFWGLLIPNGTIPGSYNGNNTVSAVKSEVGEW